MRSIFNFRAIAAIAMGVFLGGQEAMAWCPTSSTRIITCNNCTVTLTCDVYSNVGTIELRGYNVTFDGNWYNLYNNGYYGIFIDTYKGTTTIKNLYINGVTTQSAIYSRGIYSDVLRLQNVYANGSRYGLEHWNDGKVEITGGSYWDNVIGIYGWGGNPQSANGVHISGGGAWANGTGVSLDLKYKSTISNGFSAYQNSRGAYLSRSNYARVTNSYFDQNDGGSSGHGLELYNSGFLTVTGNSGYGNTGYDCKNTGSSGSIYGNTWTPGKTSGKCN